MIEKDFWNNKKVFITGHTGFKGSWLTQWLLMLGAKVKGYSLEPPTKPSLFDILGLKKEIEHVSGDIRNDSKLFLELSVFEPEIVFHLAAQPLVRLSYKEPKLTYETNVMGTLNLYEAVRRCHAVRAVVSITTDKCYENKEWVWGYRETDPMGGFDPYSSSKGCAELLSAAYRNSYFNPHEYGKSHLVALATARAGNVIGGGDWAIDRLVPDCIRALSRKETIFIRSPYSIRPWQHVLEPLSGYLLLAQKMFTAGVKYGESWNFGPGDEGVMNVENVVKNVIAAWGSGNYEIVKDADLHEAQLLKLDISKARGLLQWQPVYGVCDTLKECIAWYLEYNSGQAVSGFTCEQINRYMQKFYGNLEQHGCGNTL